MPEPQINVEQSSNTAAANRNSDAVNRPLVPRQRPVPPLDYVLKTYSSLTMILMVPVSITIFIVVWGVRNLTPLYSGRNQSPLYLAADETGAASPQKKAEAASINALVVVGMVLGITFVMVLLYKLRCIKVIIVWFVVSALMIFWLLAWVWADLVCTKYQIPYDYLGMGVFLWNFGICGVIALFYYAPSKMMQGYLVYLSIIMGWMLTRLPEWSTWGILLAVAVYDICAVLLPGGPLKMLVKESQDRNEPIPGFVYDSGDGALVDTRQRRPNPAAGPGAGPPQNRPAPAPQGTERVAPSEPRGNPIGTSRSGHTPTSEGNHAAIDGATSVEMRDHVAVTPSVNGGGDGAAASAAERMDTRRTPGQEDGHSAASQGSGGAAAAARPPAPAAAEESDEEEPDPFESADIASPFKLGLGDFIFYSLLVGRAAQFSYVSWMTCYVCVINGLVGTLICLLFLRGKVPALPALPFSIFAGVAAYFVTRYTTVPYNYYLSVSGLTV